MFNFIIENLITIAILYFICMYLAFKYCCDDIADIWQNEKAEKIYYKLAPITLLLLFIEMVATIIWTIKI